MRVQGFWGVVFMLAGVIMVIIAASGFNNYYSYSTSNIIKNTVIFFSGLTLFLSGVIFIATVNMAHHLLKESKAEPEKPEDKLY